MKSQIILLAVFSLAAPCKSSYAEVTDNQAFYRSHQGQVFKESDLLKITKGYIRGDEVQYITWRGHISGVPVYFEAHGEKIKIHAAKNRSEFSLRQAPAVPGGDPRYYTISNMDSDFYVKSMPNAHDSMICIESLGRDIYVPIIPYWEVYVIINPLTHPELYRLSGINASCRGIERLPDGKIVAPKWTINRTVNPNVVIDYYFLEKNSVKKNNRRVTGMITSEDGLEYVFNE